MKKLIISLLLSIILAVMVTAALEIKKYVTEPKKEHLEISVQLGQHFTHRNIACRIKRKSFPRFNKIGLL